MQQALRAEEAFAAPCLGGLTAPDLFERLAQGAERIVVLDRCLCEGCAVADCAALWAAQVETARDVLAAVAPDQAARIVVETAPIPIGVALPIIELRPELKPTRRAFFRRLTAPPPEPHDAQESQRIVRRRGLVAPVARERTLAAVARLAAATDAPMPGALAPIVTVAREACDLHGVCAAICPTGALRLTDDGETMTLDYDAAACIGWATTSVCCRRNTSGLTSRPTRTTPPTPRRSARR